MTLNGGPSRHAPVMLIGQRVGFPPNEMRSILRYFVRSRYQDVAKREQMSFSESQAAIQEEQNRSYRFRGADWQLRFQVQFLFPK